MTTRSGRETALKANFVAADLSSAGNMRRFLDGSERADVVLQSAVIGLGKYLPGWKWSQHAGPQTGKKSEAHIGYVLSGQMVIQTQDGRESIVHPGEAFEAEAGHDAWVSGNEPCIALDFEHAGEAPDGYVSGERNVHENVDEWKR
jgi:quercetin dioxygenase-like cupin family protein